MASSRFHCRAVCKSEAFLDLPFGEYEPDSLNRWRLLAKFVFVMCALIRFASDRDSSDVPVVIRNVKGILNACFRKLNCEGGLEVVPSLPIVYDGYYGLIQCYNSWPGGDW